MTAEHADGPVCTTEQGARIRITQVGLRAPKALHVGDVHRVAGEGVEPNGRWVALAHSHYSLLTRLGDAWEEVE